MFIANLSKEAYSGYTCRFAIGVFLGPSRAGNVGNGIETIVLAEDHDSGREMVRQRLVNLWYRVLSATNGDEATKLCLEESSALAILDLVMPPNGRHHCGNSAAEPAFGPAGWRYSPGVCRVISIAEFVVSAETYSRTSLARFIRKILDVPKRDEALSNQK